MRALFIDSATETFSASLISDESIVGEFSLQRPRGQLIHLLPSIIRLFQTSGIHPESLDAIAVTNGPGSFTGVRLGIITAKTVAQVLEKPVIGLNTLDAMAMNINRPDCTAGALLDARRGEIFAAFYRYEASKRVNMMGYGAYKPDRLIESLREMKGPVILTGNGLGRYGEFILTELGSGVELLPSAYWYPRASGVMPLIMEAFQRGAMQKYYELEAFYMREAEAEESLRNKTSGEKR
jgi:tRNA threonylcarbamoyladenosine biosynthesis protein TsaB